MLFRSLAAGFPKFDEMYVVSNGEELEKFAELIVRECADIATINQYQAYTAGHYVLKHFGVK